MTEARSVKVGIVIPTFNEARNIERLLRSIRSQTNSTYSIVVVDQGSTDRTAEIARSYGCTVIEIPRPKSFTPWLTHPLPGESRNIGAQAAGASILLHLDADMELAHPNFLEQLVKVIDDTHQAAILDESDVAFGFWAKCKA